MAPVIGNIFLWLSLCISVLQFFNSRRKNKHIAVRVNKFAVTSIFLLTFLSFLSLIYSHIISDFSLINVYQNSHSSKPLIYKIAGVWGNHEGSMLLWIFVLTIFNYFIYKLYNKKNVSFIAKALETQSLIIIGFLLFTVLTSNPFIITNKINVDGLGFNPILQDPALSIHPPFLYIGYVGFSAAFSLSIAALSDNNINNISWHTYMKPFVMIAWTFLTLGITLGSIWAYYELGWGGWWFWDPVENASFMPWLLGVALIHSLITVERIKALKAWVLLLAILTFLLSVIGTFLVRSGILTSVHTFALDPTRGIYILLFIALLGGYSLYVFFLKSKKFSSKVFFPFLSKGGAILINNLVLIIVCATVFLGTIYPLVVEAISKNKISVGEPYFNSTIIPIILPVILIMGIGPILSWRKTDNKKNLKRIIIIFLLTIICTLLFFINYKYINLIGLFSIFLSLWIILNNLVPLCEKMLGKINNNLLPSINIFTLIAHLGFGLLMLGITASSVWQSEKITQINTKESIKIIDYNLSFVEINEIVGPNYIAIEALFSIYDKNNNFVANLRPQKRYYPVTKIFTNEPSIHTNLKRDLYIVLGEGNKNDGWVIRLYYNPLVIWIWIGALIIFISGLSVLKNNLYKIRKLKNE